MVQVGLRRTIALAFAAMLACQPSGGAQDPEPQPQQAAAPAQKGALIPLSSNLYGRYKWAQDAPSIGDTAPDFTLPLVDGSTFNLAQAARAAGDVAIVFYRGFW